jgi:uncharacterized protein YceH (UPF0502 family)
MDIHLEPYEARVIGALIEKEITTPDQYPLSLNALTNACNQKSNRDPVLNLPEATVQDTVDGLIKKHLVAPKSGFGSRVTKYQHRLCNTAFSSLKLSEQELGIICALLLRGPQTAGELRVHTTRLCQFRDVQEVEATLKDLMDREDGPFVSLLAREPGKREPRYAHLLGGPLQTSVVSATEPADFDGGGGDAERLDRLERQVNDLRQEIEQLKRMLLRLGARMEPDDGP